MSEQVKISLMSHGGDWILVAATVALREGNAMGTSKSRLRTVKEVFWTGEEWSAEIADAYQFTDQSEAIEHREFHQKIVDSLQ